MGRGRSCSALGPMRPPTGPSCTRPTTPSARRRCPTTSRRSSPPRASFFAAFGWTVATSDDLEADDLLGTYASSRPRPAARRCC